MCLRTIVLSLFCKYLLTICQAACSVFCMPTRTSNLTINRATSILVAAGILPSPCISITDNKSGRVKNNRVASITVQNGEHMEDITVSIDAALATGGYKVGWYYKANGDKQTAYQTTV